MRRIRALGASAAIAACLVLASALPAAAHNYVVSSTPEEGETLTAVPEFFVITANEAMLDLSGDAAGFAMQITDESGLFYGDGCVTVQGDTMATAGALGGEGDYTLTYQFVSSDGHTVSDELAFRFAPVDGAGGAEGSESAAVCPGAAETGDRGVATTPSTGVDESAVVIGIIAGIIAALTVLGVVIASRMRQSRATGENPAIDPEVGAKR